MTEQYRISLIHRYKDHLGCISHGTFFEGSIVIHGKEQAAEVCEKFEKFGIIKLFEATRKYVSEQVSSEAKIFEFCNVDETKNFGKQTFTKSNHEFGKGYIYFDVEHGYKFYYWLLVEKI